jgi:putative transposase
MAIPVRNSDAESVLANERTFFVTSKTAQGRALLQSDRMATLFIDVLRSYVGQHRFKIHEFVVMPNHVHFLLTIGKEMTVEKAVQLIKGNFSYRAKKEFGIQYQVWQRGFSEVRIADRDSFLAHKLYIQNNPVKAGLVNSPEEFPYSSAYLRKKKLAKAAGRG